MLDQATKQLIQAMTDNTIREHLLERQFLAVLRDPKTTAEAIELIEAYIEDTLIQHPDRPPAMHVYADRIHAYITSRLRRVGWQDKREELERDCDALEQRRHELNRESFDIENAFCAMLDEALDDDEIELMSDDEVKQLDAWLQVPTLDEGEEIWPRSLKQR